MTYATVNKNVAAYIGYSRPKRRAIVNVVGMMRHVFRSLIEAMYRSRLRKTEQEIGRYVALRGGMITDAVEREIEFRLLRSDWIAR